MSEPEQEPTEPTPETPEEPETPGEPEQPGEDETTEQPDEPEQPGEQPEEQPEPVGDKEIEKAFKALGKLRESVANRVGSIMGEDAQQLVPCPTCQDIAPGFIFPPTVAPLSPEAEAGTRLLLGMTVPGDYEKHPNAELCETCQGLGKVETPSKVPGYDVVDCPGCSATGRILTSSAPTGPATNGEVVAVPQASPVAVTGASDDAFIREAQERGYVAFKAPDMNPQPIPS